MLKSSNCFLTDKNEDELAKLGECPLDPGMIIIFTCAIPELAPRWLFYRERNRESNFNARAVIQKQNHY